MPEILGNGIYSFSEAAWLTKLTTRRVRSWFNMTAPDRKHVFLGDYPKEHAISFLDLIEVLVAGNMRREGVSLAAIRRMHKRLSEKLSTSHPFSHQELYAFQGDVFVVTAEEMGEEQSIVDILTHQRVFPKIVKPCLKRVTYDSKSRMAKEWNIWDGIVIDPARRFGKPIVSACGIPASILSSAYHANKQDVTLVASWYGINTADVEAAVNFCTRREAA
jgi:uncharacterized protein (DUF433 family)